MTHALPMRPPRQADDGSSAIASAHQFEQCYKDAYLRVDTAINLVTENKHEQAGQYFQCGLTLLERALEVDLNSLNLDTDTLNHYTEMQHKMRMTRKEVGLHFFDSQVFSGGVGESGYPTINLPPSGSDGSVAYPQLPAEELTPSITLPPRPAPLAVPAPLTPIVTPVLSPQEGQLLFRIETGVQIFFIFPDGRVTSPSNPSFLEVITFNSPLTLGRGSVAAGYLQVGEWSYPLVKASSPVLHSFYGAYMFPDTSNAVPGSHVGIIIPDSVAKQDKELFESILTGMTSYQQQEPQPHLTTPSAAGGRRGSDGSCRSTQSTASEKIAAGAEALSTGVVWGAGKMSQLMTHLSDRLQESSVPVADDPNAVQTKIDPKLQTTAKAARSVSGKAVQVSSYVRECC